MICTTTTSRTVHEYKQKIDASYQKQKISILKCLSMSVNPLSMRELEVLTRVPIYIITRIIAEYEKSNQIEVKFIGKSRLSGYPKVKHYGINK